MFVSRLRTALFALALVATASSCDNSVDQFIPDPELTPEGWELIWSDEFGGAELDTTKWTLVQGDGCPNLCGFGNNELQIYTDENHEVSNGTLKIEARRTVVGDDTTYTSTRMNTRGKGDWTYGRYEIKAKLPRTQGHWPAIWMFFSEDTYGGWAASGEIDIMENIGNKPAEIFGTIHYGGPFPDNVFSGTPFDLFSGTFADDFFVFTLEWDASQEPETEDGERTKTELRWYVNNVLYQTKTSDDWFSTGSDNPDAPFNHDFHMILNSAVGGRLPGNPDASTVFPQTMEVDYVRVYERTGTDGGA